MHDHEDREALGAAVATKFEFIVKAVITVLKIPWDDACAWVEVAIAGAWACLLRGRRREPVRRWSTYLVNAAIRMARRDLKRRNTRAHPQEVSFERLMASRNEESQAYEPEAPVPTDWEARERVIARVRCAVGALPPRERLVVELFYFMGRSHAEIAAELGITEPSSQVTLSRAIARLRSMLRDAYGEAA